MARTTLQDRKQAALDKKKAIDDELKAIEKAERDAARKARERKIHLIGTAILKAEGAKTDVDKHAYRDVMALLDRTLENADDRELFGLKGGVSRPKPEKPPKKLQQEAA
jgi:hypothetical protein